MKSKKQDLKPKDTSRNTFPRPCRNQVSPRRAA